MPQHLRIVALLTLVALAACGAQQQARDEVAAEQSSFHYQLGIGYYEEREVPMAIRELNQAIEIYPENDAALFLLAFIFQGRRDYEEAERLYLRVMEVAPDRMDVRNNLGTVYLEQGRWEEAAERFRELTRMPTYQTPGHAHNNLGWALYQLGDVRGALEQFELAVMFQPDMCLAYNNQGLMYEELGNVAAAQRSYERALRGDCTSYQEPMFRLGALLAVHQIDMTRAVELFGQCYDVSPESTFGMRCAEYLSMLAP